MRVFHLNCGECTTLVEFCGVNICWLFVSSTFAVHFVRPLGYLNWRRKGPQGARGDVADVFLHPEKAGCTVTAAKNDLFLKQRTRQKATRCAALIDDSTPDDAATDVEGAAVRKRALPLPKRAPKIISFVPSPVLQSPHSDVTVGTIAAEAAVALSSPTDSVTETQETQRNVDHAFEEEEKEKWLKFYYNPFTPQDVRTCVPLRQCNLDKLPASIQVPSYPRGPSHVTDWILHVGVGGFHRSHQAVYLNDLLVKQHCPESEGAAPLDSGEAARRWGICGVGLRESDRQMSTALKHQDYLYTVLTRASHTSSATVIGSLSDFLLVPDRAANEIAAWLVSPSTRLVSLTVTEKGYCQNVEGGLDIENPLVSQDLQNLENPHSAIGFITLGLQLRRAAGVQPFTVLSCDNLPENGTVLKQMVLEFAELLDPTLALWIKDNVGFPRTMVDRITPVTGPEHRDILRGDFGVEDEWPVVAEDFRQWIIEDSFCNSRPQWESVGAILVSDVQSYELMKLRLLNGGHSAMVYISYLAGYRFVDDAVADVRVSSFLRAYMDEMTSTIRNVTVELERYKEKVVERFGNSYIKDSLKRIAEDGSIKFYNTMKDALIELLEEKRHVYNSALAIACWIWYLTGRDEQANPIELMEPKVNVLKPLALEALRSPHDPDTVATFLRNVFGTHPLIDGLFANEVALALVALKLSGSQAVLEAGGPLHCLFNSHLQTRKGVCEILDFIGYSADR
eukprot:GHVT01011861.1.p1 GENE.GHVT01011861.1~~GHVT01011861.1.p1  ORF type:complete len:736 (+),score=131.03 GHVT01011861.1:2865-5072(+)